MQLRLVKLGHVIDDLEGHFGPSTARSIGRFQGLRGLRVTATVDRATWDSIVEASYRLGDRLLYLKSPMTRGDDVAELQARLGSIGFDPGRVDGIFGERTSAALKDFQENVDLPTDGICGKETITELLRVFGRSPEHVHGVRERESLRNLSKTIGDTAIAISHFGDLEPAAETISQRLKQQNVHVHVISDPDPSIVVPLVNRLAVDLTLHLEMGQPDSFIAYYSGYSYVSPRGKTLSQLLATEIEKKAQIRDLEQVGLAIQILRETKMPTVIISFKSPTIWVKEAPHIADAVVGAVNHYVNWVEIA